MCTASSHPPPGNACTQIASSKSRASSGSIVITSRSRQSSLTSSSQSGIVEENASTSRNTSCEKATGRPYLCTSAKMVSPGVSAGPNDFTNRATGRRPPGSHDSTRASTLWPAGTTIRSSVTTSNNSGIAGSSGRNTHPWPRFCTVATNPRWLRSRIRTTRPSTPSRARFIPAFTTTRSPGNARPVSEAGT